MGRSRHSRHGHRHSHSHSHKSRKHRHGSMSESRTSNRSGRNLEQSYEEFVLWDEIKKKLPFEQRAPENNSCCPQCSLVTRIRWFASFILIGLVLYVFSFLCMAHNIKVFAVLYSLANCIFLISTLFLVGLCKQLKMICSSCPRFLALMMIFLFITLTLMCAFYWNQPTLAILCGLGQFICFCLYAFTYLPEHVWTFLCPC